MSLKAPQRWLVVRLKAILCSSKKGQVMNGRINTFCSIKRERSGSAPRFVLKSFLFFYLFALAF